MPDLIAREKELEIIEKAVSSEEAEFLALYGRRRVGKTYLIRTLLSRYTNYFELTGLKNGALEVQLQNFIEAFSENFYPNIDLKRPKSWRDAFNLLTKEMEKMSGSEKIILFFDELPWLATKKSKFLEALDYFWNTRWQKMNNVLLVVCGSAASWMLEKLIHAKGGLHNRLTRTILLKPFSLKEVELFLKTRGIHLNRAQILELYMAMGGIPHYLKQVQKGKSATQNIDDICFKEDGLLYREFSKLFPALFENPESHEKIIRILALSRKGLSRTDLLKQAQLSTGGTFNKRIQELEATGFIESYLPYGQGKNTHYRIIDEYLLFYFKWVEPILKKGQKVDPSGYWAEKSKSDSFQSWSGYAFEAICLKHIQQIKHALGLSGIACEYGSWRWVPKKREAGSGAQIDLLFDREDGVITLCEIKYSNSIFQIDRAYGQALLKKSDVFADHFKTNKQIFISMITKSGLKKNLWSEELINDVVVMDDLYAM